MSEWITCSTIFEGTFDDLMKKVRRQEFVNICMWKSMCERLGADLRL